MSAVRIRFTETDGLPLCAADRFCRLDTDGARLAPAFLTCIDQGRVLHTHNEEIGRFVWARQCATLPLEQPAGGALSLFLYEYEENDEPLEVVVNGEVFTIAPSPELQGTYNWRTMLLRAGLIQPGNNEVLVRSRNVPFRAWVLAVDVGAPGGQSAKSWDQGATWHDNRLGLDYTLRGEYVIRWWIDAPPPYGTVTSPVLHTPLPGKVDAAATGDGEIELIGRWGDTVEPSDQSWKGWQPFPLAVTGPYFQWQARLSRGTAEPVLRSIELIIDRGTRPATSVCDALVADLQPWPTGAYQLTLEQPDHPELRMLWEAESLAPLIAQTTTDLERARALCSWVHAQWIHNNSYDVYTPWHPSTILDWQRTGRGHNSKAVTGFCVHFAVTLAQICTAANLRARGVVLGTRTRRGMDGHFVCEVFCRELNKWVMLDADFDYYFAHRGVPLNVLDIHTLWNSGSAQEIAMVRGAGFSRNPMGHGWPLEHLRSGGYRWFGLPMRQNWLSQPDVQPANHGVINYCETDIIWWTDDHNLQRCFPLTTTRVENLYLAPNLSYPILPEQSAKQSLW